MMRSVTGRGICAAGLFALGLARPGAAEDLPVLQDGDLVFQSSSSGQSGAVLAATGHPFTHMGIVKVSGDQALVVEAWSEVMVTPLADWVARDATGRVAIYRDPDLTPDQASAVVAEAERYLGRPYDIFFLMGVDEIYCSELAWLAYGAVGLEIGEIEQFGELNIGDARVQALVASRWQADPVCGAEAQGVGECLELLKGREMVTPASIAEDARFNLIYSSFP